MGQINLVVRIIEELESLSSLSVEIFPYIRRFRVLQGLLMELKDSFMDVLMFVKL